MMLMHPKERCKVIIPCEEVYTFRHKKSRSSDFLTHRFGSQYFFRHLSEGRRASVGNPTWGEQAKGYFNKFALLQINEKSPYPETTRRVCNISLLLLCSSTG